MSPSSVTVVIPCFNEVRRLASTFAGIDRLPDVVTEVVLVDDGSSDGTLALALALASRRNRVRVLAEPHRGKGGAVRAGVLTSQAAWVCFADADWSVPPDGVLDFLPPRAPVADVLVATREAVASRRVGEPRHRHLLGRAFNAWVRAVALPGLQDSQCGFKVFRGDAARALFGPLSTSGWAFDVELLRRAQLAGLRIAEVPVVWTHDGDSRVRVGRDALGMAAEVVRIRRMLPG
ncbi:MAG: glycosyltransferase [Myxococcales bacterium]|nr:glycosyltransferase [Myxococcales bacterium]